MVERRESQRQDRAQKIAERRRSPTAGARQPEREERAHSLSEGKESEFEEEHE